MTSPASRHPSVAGSLALDARAVESRLCELVGVRKAAVAMDGAAIQRIDVIVDGSRDAKRLVRDIETIVRAEFSVAVNYKSISIVADTRVTPGAGPAVAGSAVSAPASTTAAPIASGGDVPAHSSPSRAYTLEHVNLEQGRVHPTGCTVALRRGSEVFTGTATVVLPREAVETLAARATLAALQQIDPRVADVVLIGVRGIVEFDDACMVAKVVAPSGQHETALYGIAPLANRPEIAASLAVLDATNRWLAVKDH
jgi:hypothetical protein